MTLRRPLPGTMLSIRGMIGTVLACLIIAGVVLNFAHAQLHLDAGAESDLRLLGNVQHAQTDEGRSLRWSGNDPALLNLHGFSGAPLLLSLRLATPQGVAQRQLDLTASSKQRIAVGSTWRVYHLLMQPERDSWGQAQALTLQPLNDNAVPTGLRTLGIAIDTIDAVPVTGWAYQVGLLWMLLIAALWAAWVAGLCWLIIRITRLQASFAPIAPFVAGILTLLLYAVAYTINPCIVGWLVPPMPWLWVASAVFLLIFRGHLPLPRNEDDEDSPADLPNRWTRIALLILFGLALFLRWVWIDRLPYGLWRDEARHGMLALRIAVDPWTRPAYDTRIDLPILGMFPFAGAFQLLGIHVWTMRLVTGLAGALTIWPLYGLTRLLFGRRDIALGAAFFLAVSGWHISISRFSFPTVFDPLFMLSGLYLVVLATQRSLLWQRLGLAIGAGICFGVALQTYHTGRLAPIFTLLLLAFLWWVRRVPWRTLLPIAACCGLAFLAASAPLLDFALHHSDRLNERVSTVFLLAPKVVQGQSPLSVLDESLRKHLLMLHVQGDSNGRHYAPGRPLLDTLTGIGFLLGLFAALRRRLWGDRMVLCALALAFVPGILAVESPHAMRTFDVVGFASILAAVGWQWAFGFIDRPLRKAVLGIGLGLILLLNTWTYFVAMPNTPAVWQAVYPAQTQMGIAIRENQLPTAPAVYVLPAVASQEVFRFLTTYIPVQEYDTATAANAPEGALLLLSGYTWEQDLRRLPDGLRAQLIRAGDGPFFPDGRGPSFVTFRITHSGK